MTTITSLLSTDNWAVSRTTINTNFTNVNTEVETASTDIDTLQWIVVDATTTVKWLSKASVAPVSASAPIFVWDNDPRVPTQWENDALVWYSGTDVGTSNKFIDAANVDTAATADKVVRRIAAGQITVPTTPSASTDASSKSYVDTTTASLWYQRATASTNYKINSTAEVSTNDPWVMKSIVIPFWWAVKISYETKGSDITTMVTAIVWCTKTYWWSVWNSSGDTTYVTITWDLVVCAGETLNLVRTTANNWRTCYVKNFQIWYDLTSFPIPVQII